MTEQELHRSLRVTTGHIRERTKFHSDLLNIEKKLWITGRGRGYSNKASLIAKRIADLVQEQAKLWQKHEKILKDTSETRFEEHNIELEKRMLQLQFNLLMLAQEISRKETFIHNPDKLESEIHEARKATEFSILQKNLNKQSQRSRQHAINAHITLDIFNLDRVILHKIDEISNYIVRRLRSHMNHNIWQGNGRDNARSDTRELLHVCRKLDDDVMLNIILSRIRK